MSAHIHHEGEKNDEDYETHMVHEEDDHKDQKYEDCDYLFPKVEDHTSHTVDDHTGHDHELIGNPIYDNPKYDNPIFDNGSGVHNRPKDIVLQKFRRGQAGHHQ